MYLAGSLKAHGHHADLVQTDKDDLDDFIQDYRPDYVAFSITTGEHIYAIKVARYVKEKYGIPNIFGGPHCTFFPEIGFEKDLDFVVQGQAENLIVDIVEGRAKPGFHKAELAEHLDDLPFPDRSIFYQYAEFRDNPMKNVITSRACPYKCSYCFNHSQFALTKIDGETKRWFNRRSLANVVREIHEIQKHYPLGKIAFIDDNFIQNADWLREFSQGYERDIHLPWICSLRVNSLTDELGEKMFRSGLEMINYAMESSDPDVQQRLLHRGHITNSDIINAIALMSRHGVRARMQNMIGLPLDNPLEDALNTLQFNLQHRVTDSWCSIFQPYPRTALGQYCVNHGFTTEDQLRHCSESFFDESRIAISNKPEIYALQKLWYFAVDSNIPLDLLQILIRGRFTKEVGDQIQKLRFLMSRKRLYRIDDAQPAQATDLKSRERWGGMDASDDIEPTVSGRHMGTLLRQTSLPSPLVDILTQVEFRPQEIEDTQKHLAGQQVYPTPIYTLKEDGALADPSISIYIRGTKNPELQDIRKMPESAFLQNIVAVRETLTAFTRGNDIVAAETSARQTPVDHAGLEAARPEVTHQDERHLNQYRMD